MNKILAPLLVIMEDEIDAFWCFAGFMDLIGDHFNETQNSVYSQLITLSKLLCVIDPQLYHHLDNVSSYNRKKQIHLLKGLFLAPVILLPMDSPSLSKRSYFWTSSNTVGSIVDQIFWQEFSLVCCNCSPFATLRKNNYERHAVRRFNAGTLNLLKINVFAVLFWRTI